MLTAIEARVISNDTTGEISEILGMVSSAASDGRWLITLSGYTDEYVLDALRTLGYKVEDIPPFGKKSGWEVSWYNY